MEQKIKKLDRGCRNVAWSHISLHPRYPHCSGPRVHFVPPGLL